MASALTLAKTINTQAIGLTVIGMALVSVFMKMAQCTKVHIHTIGGMELDLFQSRMSALILESGKTI